jgi:DNA repair protein RAD5
VDEICRRIYVLLFVSRVFDAYFLLDRKSEMPDAPPDCLFFPDPDDNEMATERDPQDQLEGTSSLIQPEPLLGKRLFLSDSEDEDSQKTFAPLILGGSTYNEGTHTDNDIEIPSVEDEPETSSISNMSSVGVSAPSSPTHSIVELVQSPPKKRRISPVAPPQATFSSAYLGSFLVGNAWSTVKGKGYVLPGDQIKLERDDTNESTSSKAKAKVGGKAKNAEKGKTKQLSIATLLKPQQPKLAKKKVDSVVRLTNDRGFGWSTVLVRTCR